MSLAFAATSALAAGLVWYRRASAAVGSDEAKEAGPEKKVVMVTGGRGLVGMGIQQHLAKNPPVNETWIFLSSKDGDLRCVFVLLCEWCAGLCVRVRVR